MAYLVLYLVPGSCYLVYDSFSTVNIASAAVVVSKDDSTSLTHALLSLLEGIAARPEGEIETEREDNRDSRTCSYPGSLQYHGYK